MDSQIPDELNWVQARGECSLHQMFTELRKRVESDVNARTAQLSERQTKDRIGFQFEAKESGDYFTAFAVHLKRFIRFYLDQNKNVIDISSEPAGTEIEATITFNPAGQCRLVVNGQEHTVWQVARLSLEKLFYDTAHMP